MTTTRYDIAIIGAGIVGLAHALAAARRGLRVIVIDGDSRANGASIRNFGFITVTGQSAGAVWNRARRSRDVWAEIAPRANIEIVHRNECLIVHSAEAQKVLAEFKATEMGADCELLSREQVLQRAPMANANNVCGALWSPHELRIEPRTAQPALAAYLQSEYDVTIEWGVHVWGVAAPVIETSAGKVFADRLVVATGPDFVTLFPQIHAKRGVRLCKLQMLRLAPQPPGWRLPASIMSDLGLIRYEGFSAQPAAAVLRETLAAQDPEILAHGIHLIVVQSCDGSLVVGDSHEYGATLDPFYSTDIEAAILRLAYSVLNIPNHDVIERWIGLYPQSESCEAFVEAPDARTRVVQVTTGNGMSTSFGFAEEVIGELLGEGVFAPTNVA